jgi:hypothetical protein
MDKDKINKLKELYTISRELNPTDFEELVKTAKSNDEKEFFNFITDHALKCRQQEFLKSGKV